MRTTRRYPLALFAALFLAAAVTIAAGRVAPPAIPMPPGAQAPNTLTETERAAGWTLLFDGRTTQGWRGFHSQEFPAAVWIVEDGSLRHVARQAGGDIVTVEQYDNFDLQFEWKISPGGNSGVKYLIAEDLVRTGRSGLGFEMQVLDDDLNPDAKAGRNGNRTAGALYDLIPPAARMVRPVGQWNQARVLVQHNHVEHWLNGTKLLEFELGSPALRALIAQSKYRVNPGFGDARIGHILLQDHQDDAWFRSIRIRRLSAD